MADDNPIRAPIRGNPGTTSDARPRGQLGHAQHQPGQTRRREPPAPPRRATTVRIVGRDPRARRPARSTPRSARPFAAATGLRPSEWLALELRDIDHEARVAYVRRAYRNGRIKCPKTDGSIRAVPLQAIALEALDALPGRNGSALVFPAPRGGYIDLHNFRYRDWKPAQRELEIDPIRRIYDLRHTFATFALRAGISTFDLSRYMGASLTMIDRHYGHLAKDGRQHAINLLDTLSTAQTGARVHAVDAKWTRTKGSAAILRPKTLA